VTPSNLHVAWAELFVRSLLASGVTDVVLSPGSRSTPFAVALAREKALRVHVVIDERAAAFVAVGQARVTGRPSLLVCTSGTAGAHYLPAVIEASQSFVPLVVVTADRPWELGDVGAPQTIDQTKMFGSFVRHFAELGAPDVAALCAVPRIAAQAVARSTSPVPGPVHVNARFRKPLEPQAVTGPEAWQPIVEGLLHKAAPRVHAPVAAPSAACVEALAERIRRAERGLLVAGPAPISAASDREILFELARRTGFPLLAECTSQLRFAPTGAGVTRVSAFDALLASSRFRAGHAPDLVIELGRPPTSAAYARFVEELPACSRWVVSPYGYGDPSSRADAIVQAAPGELARALVAALPGGGRASAWAASFHASDEAARDVVDDDVAAPVGEGKPVLSEAAAARALLASCPVGSLVVVGNSSPVRDLDAYCFASDKDVAILHQRGASGIDGLLAGAFGARTVAAAPVALLLGDVSLMHDVGALSLLSRADAALVVVVVQNGGGRIFDALPVRATIDPETFERFFATPVRVDFGEVARAFGVPFRRAEDERALEDALAEGFRRRGATLIEVVAAPREGALRAERIRGAVDRRLGNEEQER
jgi:2-succinyl-5-enolpyruvyl-6-hydroxy-3-cyclohexene-1-carboxylate synthase